MNIVIWWNIPCKAISGVIKELSKIDDLNIISITGRLSIARKEMGWEENAFHPAKHIFIEDDEWNTVAVNLLNDYSNYLHIFNGFHYPKRMNNIIKRAVKKGLKFGIFSEAPSNPYTYFKGFLASVYHRYILPNKANKIANSSEFYFSLSGSGENEIRKINRLGWPNNKIIGFGYFSEDFSDLSQRTVNNIPNIFCPGNLVPHKGVDILLKALEVASKEELKFHCHITGKGPEKIKLLKLTDKLGLKENVTFHGVLDQNEYNMLQNKMDILVAPGRIEPWGIRVNEGIQNGQVVIISDKIGAKELISSSKGGAVFKSGNYTDLASKLIPYLKDPKIIETAQSQNLIYKEKISPKSASKYVYEVLKAIENNNLIPKPIWL